MKRIVLFGMPGSGKSTQGKKIANYLNCPWISTGEILRNSKEKWVQEKLKTAELFDDHLMLKLIQNALNGKEDAVIDGFPRTEEQVKMAVEDLGISKVIELTVLEEEALSRLKLRGRDQDDEKIAYKRIEDYKNMRMKVEEKLWQYGIKIERVDGNGTEEEVFERIKEVL